MGFYLPSSTGEMVQMPQAPGAPAPGMGGVGNAAFQPSGGGLNGMMAALPFLNGLLQQGGQGQQGPMPIPQAQPMAPGYQGPIAMPSRVFQPSMP